MQCWTVFWHERLWSNLFEELFVDTIVGNVTRLIKSQYQFDSSVLDLGFVNNARNQNRVSRISWYLLCVILKTNVDTEARNICLQGRSPVKWRSNLISSGCNWYHRWQLYKTFDGIVCSCLVFPSSPSQPHCQAGHSHKGAAGWCYRHDLNSLTTIKSKSKHTWSIFYKFRLKNNQTIWKWLFYNPKEC